MKEEFERIVVPGSIIKRVGRVRLGEYISNIGRTYVSTLLGVLYKLNNEVGVIPYKDIYKPKPGDYIIGIVVSYAPSGWVIELGTYTKGFLPAQDYLKDIRFNPRKIELSNYIKVGDMVGAKIIEVNRHGYFLLTTRTNVKDKQKKHLGVLKDYYIIKVSSTKLPRIIGRKGNMIKIIKEKIDGEIIIAQNGVILYKGEYNNFKLLQKIVELIVYKTFASSLTDAVASILGLPASEVNKEQEVGDENE